MQDRIQRQPARARRDASSAAINTYIEAGVDDRPGHGHPAVHVHRPRREHRGRVRDRPVRRRAAAAGSCRKARRSRATSETTDFRGCTCRGNRRRPSSRRRSRVEHATCRAPLRRRAMSNLDADKLKVFTGRANPQLAQKICDYLQIPLGRGKTELFPDGELIVKVEEDVRGRDCFIVQPTSHPVNAHLMELFIWIDCLRRRQRQPGDGGHPVLRLRPAGPQGRGPHADHRQAGGQPARAGRRRPRGRGRPARRPGAGILRHPGRPPERRRRCSSKWFKSLKLREPRVRLAGRRQREARPGLRQHARRRDLHHRQAPQERQRDQGRAHHRRRRRTRTS